jgi:phosphopantothenoylcysteine decarboxylase/phosphopantothenate--cysteine ligase
MTASIRDRRIIVGITGGVAAYKAAFLVRLLKQAGALVQVVMTQSAEAFVTPLTFQALSQTEVRTALFDPQAEAGMGHIELARWADVIVIVPASAHIMAAISHGWAHDLLTTLCLAAQHKPIIVPAMNEHMWCNPFTQDNVARLMAHGVPIWGPAEGVQACGDEGPGRMLEPAEIFTRLDAYCAEQFNGLEGLAPDLKTVESAIPSEVTFNRQPQTVVITAGPTHEPLDPVRYLGNQSSGKMGYALAQAAIGAGMNVILISGPTALVPPVGVDYRPVKTAAQMYAAVMAAIHVADIFIAAAAVADYTPVFTAPHKIKKHDQENLVLKLKKTHDILKDVAQLERSLFLVGFAAETHNIEAYALQKLEDKKLDLIVANDVSVDAAVSGIGFGSDHHAVTVYTACQQRFVFKKQPKALLACQLWAIIDHMAWQKNKGITQQEVLDAGSA